MVYGVINKELKVVEIELIYKENMNEEELPDKKNLPKWPESLPIPESVETTSMHIIEAEDMESDDNVRELIGLMYAHQEREFYLYLVKGKSANKVLLDRLESFGILRGASEFYYYRRPDLESSYIRVQRQEIQYDWQNKIVDKGPMFFRVSLKLYKAMMRRLEIQEHLAVNKAQDVNPLELKPGLFGIAINLLKLPRFYRWTAELCRKRQWKGLGYKGQKIMPSDDK